MKTRNLMTVLVVAAGCATMAQAQTYYGGGYAPAGRYAERRDIGRDLRVREDLVRRIEADRCAVERERRELRFSGPYNAGHEARELNGARERLENDTRALNSVNRDLHHDRW